MKTITFSVEPFRGDFEELERMAHLSWREEYGEESFPNFYNPAFLRFHYDRIQDKRHFMAVYRGDELAAFLGNIPQKFLFQGKERRSVYTCLMVTRREFLRQGVASLLVEESLKLNHEMKYDFALFTLEKGHGSTKFIQKLEAAGHPVQWIRKFHVAAHILDLDRASHSEGLKGWEKGAVRLYGGHRLPRDKGLALREYRPDDLPGCFALLDEYRESVSLCLLWEPEALGQELDLPGISHTFVYEKDDRVEAMANFIIHEHLGKTREKWAWINHMAIHRLTDKEKRAFIRGFLHAVHDLGLIGVVEWIRGYYSLKPLFQTRFFPYFRHVNLVSWTFNPDLDLTGTKKVYQIQI